MTHRFLTFLWLSSFEEGLALYLNSLHPRIICTKFDSLLVLEKRILKNFQCIFILLLLPPLGEGQSPSFNKFDQWFWRRFLKDPTLFLHFCDYLPFEEDLALHLNKFESWFVATLVEIGPAVLEKEVENVKSSQTDRRTTDNRRSEKLTWAFSSGEPTNESCIKKTPYF